MLTKLMFEPLISMKIIKWIKEKNLIDVEIYHFEYLIN